MDNRSNDRVNIMIVGIGNHSKKAYISILRKYQEILPVRLVAGVEIYSTYEATEAYLAKEHLALDMLYVSQFDVTLEEIPSDIQNELDLFVEKHNVNAIIIASEPLVHKVYAKWALHHGLHILMDKPITTRSNVVSDISEAKGIESDYLELLSAYQELQKSKNTIFSVNVQRRYDNCFHQVFDLITETRDRFNIPVTSIQAQHADGVWIFPHEIVEQICHPYFQGYGKCSHSGYHLFDIVWQIYNAGMIQDKAPDTAEVMTSFIQPLGLLEQFNQKDYENLFGDEYRKVKKWTDEELQAMYQSYGENDAFSMIRLLKNSNNICNISINLIHNSFSRRDSVAPGADLYKKNGRVKTQSIFIQQGPFQAIHIHNYQSKSLHDTNSVDDYALGGNNHFDIFVFRNVSFYDKGEQPLRIINVSDLIKKQEGEELGLHIEEVKERVVVEFIQFILGKVSKSELISNIDAHQVPVSIMSSIYQSHVQQMQNETPIVCFPII